MIRATLLAALLFAICRATVAADAGYVRGAYGHDTSYSSANPETTGFQVMRSAGFNTIQAEASVAALDALAANNLKGVVWAGDYDSNRCAFQNDDAALTNQIAPIKGHPATMAYYIADEPLAGKCPAAPTQLRARTALIHRLDPGSQTFTVIQDYEAGVGQPYKLWAGSGAVDIFGFDVYPCTRAPYSCNLNMIDDDRAAIESLGFSPYWAVIQDFQDCYYGLPTETDLRGQLLKWLGSRMAGYFVFSWDYKSAEPGCGRYGVQLESVPANVQMLTCLNASTAQSRGRSLPC